MNKSNSEREEIEKVALDISMKHYNVAFGYDELWPEEENKLINSWVNDIKDAILTQVEKARADENERCAKIVEDHLIYTGPGGVDPEPIQKILSDAIRNKLNQKGE